MTLGSRIGLAALAFIAGAAVVHCGTTDFASVAGDNDGGSTSSKGSSSASGGTSGSVSSTGTASSSASASTGSRSSSASGSGSATPCVLSSPDCHTGDYCCFSSTTHAATCDTAPCPAGTDKTCAAPNDCRNNAGGASCCINPTASTTYGVCVTQAECISVPGDEIKCTSVADCPGGDTCSGGVCVAEVTGSGSGGSGTGSCVPGTCESLYPAECGMELFNGCAGKTLDCGCIAGEQCSIMTAGTAGVCEPSIGHVDASTSCPGGCPTGMICTGGVCQ